jgi:integrase/recombinase XerD
MRKKGLALEKLLERFKEYLIIRNSPERTIEDYCLKLARFFKYLKEKAEIDNILLVTKEDLKNYQSHLYYYRTRQGKELEPGTRYSYLIPLSAFFKFLSRNDYIPFNPMLDVELPKYQKSLPRDIMTQKEINKLLLLPNTKTTAGLRDKAILEVLYSTGIRTGEITTLTIYDMDLQKGLLKINKGKGQKDRIVPLGKIACKYLRKYLNRARPRIKNNSKTQVLFLTQRGYKFSRCNFSRIIQKYTKKLKFKKHITPHSFRHTCATQMLEQGADIRYIQELLGHESLQTTQIYTRVAIKDLKRIHKKFHPREIVRAGNI